MYITRRGQACVAYPWKGAMRRPEVEGRYGRITPTSFFISTPKTIITAEFGRYEAFLIIVV